MTPEEYAAGWPSPGRLERCFGAVFNAVAWVLIKLTFARV